MALSPYNFKTERLSDRILIDRVLSILEESPYKGTSASYQLAIEGETKRLASDMLESDKNLNKVYLLAGFLVSQISINTPNNGPVVIFDREADKWHDKATIRPWVGAPGNQSTASDAFEKYADFIDLLLVAQSA